MSYGAVQEKLNQDIKFEDFMGTFYRPTFAALQSEIRQDRYYIHAIASRYQNGSGNTRFSTDNPCN